MSADDRTKWERELNQPVPGQMGYGEAQAELEQLKEFL